MTRIFTKTFYGEYENQYIEVTESYNHIKDILCEYVKNGLDGFIELHFAKGMFTNKPIFIRLSNITEVFSITEDETDD